MIDNMRYILLKVLLNIWCYLYDKAFLSVLQLRVVIAINMPCAHIKPLWISNTLLPQGIPTVYVFGGACLSDIWKAKLQFEIRV